MYKYVLLISFNLFAVDVVKICQKNQDIYSNCTLVDALAKIESNHNPKAINKEGTTSYGVMQVQCSTARMLGFKGNCEELLKPDTNIKYAMIYLDYQSKRYEKLEDVIASYNSGSVIKRNDEYINKQYIDKVLTVYNSKLLKELSFSEFILTQ